MVEGVGGALFFRGNQTGATATQLAVIHAYKSNGTAGNTDGDLAFCTRVNGGNTTEKMRILSGGNVGIGTTEAGGKLSIYDSTVADYTALRIYQGGDSDYYWDFTADVDAGDLIIGGNHSSFDLILNPTQGQVGIGIAPTTICHVYGSVANFVDTVAQASGSGSCTRFDFIGTDPDNSSNMFWSAYGNNTQRAKCTSDGDVWTSDSGILTSDERLKTNIVDASDKLADIMKLRVRNYEWTSEYHPNKVGEKKLGFIAQELETVFPSLIVENDIVADNSVEEQLYDAEDDTQYYVDGDEIPDGKAVGDVKAESQIPEGKAIGDVKVAAKDHEPVMRKSYKNAFVPILVKALQEVTVRLETAEAKIAVLESA
jgi:hypothetical protein